MPILGFVNVTSVASSWHSVHFSKVFYSSHSNLGYSCLPRLDSFPSFLFNFEYLILCYFVLFVSNGCAVCFLLQSTPLTFSPDNPYTLTITKILKSLKILFFERSESPRPDTVVKLSRFI